MESIFIHLIYRSIGLEDSMIHSEQHCMCIISDDGLEYNIHECFRPTGILSQSTTSASYKMYIKV